MIGYSVKDEEGYEIVLEQFEDGLDAAYFNFEVGETRGTRSAILKAYGVYSGAKLLGRIDVSYRVDETSVVFSGKGAKNLADRVIEHSNFEWEEK